MLQQPLEMKGYSVNAGAETSITLTLNNSLGKESYSISRAGKKITVSGGDENGLLYGCLAIAEDIRNGIEFLKISNRGESPKLAFRGIKFDLPWDTYRHSYSLDQHQATCSDVKYWESFLDMMAENRFNVLTLWNLHPYTFMIKPTNFPEASPWNETEMQAWKKLFGAIFRMAKERGIDTYVIPFNIFVTPEFAKAHNVAMDNLEHHFFVRGDTSEIVRRYTRECVTQMLNEYPDLSGMGMTLGEGMGGMTPQQREDWMKATIIEGMKRANRKSKLIHRIPFSSTTGSLGPTSIETERLTRKGIEAEAALNFIEGPVWADLKFNWSHPYSTTKLIKVHGGKLFGAYFDPVPSDYKIIWTARNEDFFCLRWGVPGFVRDHINANTQGYVGGYLIGSETYIPAKDYFTREGFANVNWKYAFQRQWLFYKCWGRLLYNPATTDDVFKSEFILKYGKTAAPLLEASALAGRTPVRLGAIFDSGFDFTLYSEGFMALNPANKREELISIDRLINQPVTDPDYVSVSNYVKTVNSGGKIDASKITPPRLAQMLEKDCHKSLDLVKNVNITNNSLLQEVADIRAWANLGLYFSEKLLGAVALETYRVKGGGENKQASINHLENALKYWDTIIGITRPLYNDMPLVHYSEQDGKPWKENDHLRFHWETLRRDVERDIEIAKSAIPGK